MKYQQMNVTLGISHSTESADYDQKRSNYFFAVLIFLAWPFLSAIVAVSTCSHQHSVRLRYSQWATPCHIQSHNQLPLIYTDTSAQGNLSSCDCVWRQHEGLQWECVEVKGGMIYSSLERMWDIHHMNKKPVTGLELWMLVLLVETGSRTTCGEKMSCRGFQAFCLQVWIINGCSDLTKNGSSILNLVLCQSRHGDEMTRNRS